MRLIDADALIQRTCEAEKNVGHVCNLAKTVMDGIRSEVNNAPTAYDVDKVVEQLEDVGQKMSESKSIQKYGKSSPANHRYYKAVSVKRAIEIVKGGGVNE